MDLNVKLKNGNLLKGVVFSPGENPRGVIVLIHGIGEHIGRYEHWAGRFREENFAFTGIDLPGHGRSDGRRGKIKSYAILHESIDLILNAAKRTFPGVPVFLYGHSLGGGIMLDYILKKNPSVKGAIITSPWLKLSFEPARVKRVLATTVKSLLPGLVQPSGLVIKYISHDQSVVNDYINDPLNHDKISVGLFTGAMSSAKYSLDHAAELRIPMLMMHGSDDMITSPEGSREFCSKAPNCELKIFEGGYHELHNEPFRDEVFRYIIAWIVKQLSGRKQNAVQN